VESDYYAGENQERNRGDWEVRNAGVGIKWEKKDINGKKKFLSFYKNLL
jgi:hypothetical protein